MAKRKTKRSPDPSPTTEHSDRAETFDEAGNPPKNRITTAEAAWAVARDLLDGMSGTLWRRSQSQGMVDGNKPHKDAVLKKAGQEWRTNFNTRETEATIDTRAEAFWQLFTGGEYMIDVCVPYDVQAEIPPTVDVAEVVARHYTSMMRRWRSLHFHTLRRIKQMLVNFVGPMFWPDEFTWMSRSMEASNFLTSAEAECDVDSLEIFAMRDTLKVPKAWRQIELEEKASRAGWKLKALRKVLIRMYKNEEWTAISKQTTTLWEEVQHNYRMKRNADYERVDFKSIPIIHLCVKEWATGMITRMTIIDDPDFHEFIFYRENAYESMERAVAPFFYDIGSGSGKIESGRSLADRIYAFGHISNDFYGCALDAAKASGSIVLEPEGELDVEKLRNIRFGGLFTVLAPGLKVAQAGFNPNINGMLGVRAVGQQINNNNTGTFRPRTEEFNAPEKTLGQVQLEHQNEATFEGNKAEWFYVQQDAWHQETYRRLTAPRYFSWIDGYKERERFMADCEREGVPRKILSRLEVRSHRVIGMGSKSNQLQITEQLWSRMGTQNERERYRTKRLYYAARVGSHNVDQFVSRETEAKLRTRDTVEAWLENNDFANGQSVPIVPEQDHVIHAHEHLVFLNKFIQKFVQGQNQQPVEEITKAVIALNITAPHLADHLTYLKEDPTRQSDYKALAQLARDTIKAFRPILMTYVDNEKKRKELEQTQAQLLNPQAALKDPKFLLEVQRMRQQLALNQMEMENRNQLRAQRTSGQMMNERMESESRQRIAEAEAATKLRRQEQVT